MRDLPAALQEPVPYSIRSGQVGDEARAGDITFTRPRGGGAEFSVVLPAARPVDDGADGEPQVVVTHV